MDYSMHLINWSSFSVCGIYITQTFFFEHLLRVWTHDRLVFLLLHLSCVSCLWCSWAWHEHAPSCCLLLGFQVHYCEVSCASFWITKYRFRYCMYSQILEVIWIIIYLHIDLIIWYILCRAGIWGKVNIHEGQCA